jgi:hypothetical protein
VGDPKALGVTLTPFKIVHDRPGEVGGHIGSLGDCTAYVVNVTPVALEGTGRGGEAKGLVKQQLKAGPGKGAGRGRTKD